MELMILMSGVIKIIIDAVIKPIPHIKPYFLPVIALGLGMIIMPLWVGSIAPKIFLVGLITGAMSIGGHEFAKNAEVVVKQLFDKKENVK